MLDSKCTRRVIGLVIILSATSTLLQFYRPAVAQTAPSARKFDEFGDVYPTDMAARLDNFAITLQNEPSARAFMIVYRSRRDLPGISSRHVNWMRNYLIYNRGLEAGRLEAIDGGAASCLSHELWIIAPGAAPVPRPDAYSTGLDETDSARKLDEYYWDAPHDMPESFSSEYSDSLDGFARALRREPRSLAYIIAYEGYRVERWDEEDERGRKKTGGRTVRDPPGTALSELKSTKALLTGKHGVSSSKIKLVNGGHRKWRHMELWIVPRGAHAPIPTPNAFPGRRRRK